MIRWMGWGGRERAEIRPVRKFAVGQRNDAVLKRLECLNTSKYWTMCGVFFY